MWARLYIGDELIHYITDPGHLQGACRHITSHIHARYRGRVDTSCHTSTQCYRGQICAFDHRSMQCTQNESTDYATDPYNVQMTNRQIMLHIHVTLQRLSQHIIDSCQCSILCTASPTTYASCFCPFPGQLLMQHPPHCSPHHMYLSSILCCFISSATHCHFS